MRMRMVMALVVAASLLVAPAAPVRAAGGPSEPLPDIPSTPVQQQTMQSRPDDPASRNALVGNQPGGGQAQDGSGRPTATPLAPTATWQVSPQTGDFSWSYPLRTPPAPGGLEPDLALSYASSAVDGRTSAANNQASWVGDGWDLSAGFVERVYGGCSEDTGGGTTPPKVGDLCWRSDNAVASYDGGGGMLICCDADGRWRAKSDDGSRIERLTGAGNGDNNGEHWRITRTDGTQLYFGSRADAKSTWTVPVFGDDTGEPCHAATFDASHCVQAWRWNLDKVVDRNGNQILYGYEPELNAYGMNLKDAAVSYTRGGTLRRIDYGLREGQPAGARVEFTVADRCVPGSDCTPSRPENWPDVPWTERCEMATCKDHHAPTFWSTKRLAKITAQVRGGAGFTDVDSWTLEQQMPNPGDGEKASLWLRGITHAGHVGGTAALPAVRFEGTAMPNRVYRIDGIAPLNRYRITGVVSESGGVLSVHYADPDCVADRSMPANPESNTLRCFPVTWAKQDFAERTDYFHKYVVDSVAQSDRISANTEQVTSYDYRGGAAWHHDTSEFTKPDKRTWNEFRGFGQVIVRTGKPGDPSGPIGKKEQRFYRGMHADRLPSGTRTVAVQPTEGPARTDHDWLRGMPLETITYNGDTAEVVDKTISEPSWQGPTATRDAFQAYLVTTGATQTYIALSGGRWRTTRTESTYDDRGLPVTADDLGDTATGSDDRCTRISYARDTAAWLLSFPSRTATTTARCSATGDVISDVKLGYDARANVTRTEELTGDGTYVTTSTAGYDAHGRVIESADALGRSTTTAYTPAVGGPVTQTVVKNPLGHTVTTTLEPAWGQPLAEVDANRRRTETAYDPLGRAVEVWLPNRPRVVDGVSYEGSAKFGYLIRDDGPSVVSTTRIGPNGNYTTAKEIYDGLLRLRQTQRPAVGGGRLLTDSRYDSQGRVHKSTQAYFNNAPVDDQLWVAADAEVPGLTASRFDGAGRVIAQIYQAGAAERWRTSMSYGGDRVDVTPPAGGIPTTTIHNVRGQTVELRQHHGSGYDATGYTYTAAGELASVTDPAGNIWRYAYDLRGNQIRVEDPDKGVSTMAYDAANQLTRISDARGITLAYAYDRLGRRTSVMNGVTVLAEWTYDAAPRGKGHPASSTRYVSGAAYTRSIDRYSALYQPEEVTVTIPDAEQTLAGTYTTHASYNPDGSPYGKTLPAAGDLPAETLTWEYDDFANLRGISGGPQGGATAEYVTGAEYSRYGEPARVQLGETGKRVWLSHYYEDSTRRLARTIVDAEVSNPKQADTNYAYDAAGNITSITDGPDNQCFRYDSLRRLTDAWTPGAGCGTDPATAATAGPAPYRRSFTYDAGGNRLTETDGTTTRTYAYSAPGAHDLVSVTSGTTTDEYAYDAAGNTVRRPGQTLGWDALGKLTKVTAGGGATEYVHDADGGRLVRRDPAGRTLYLDGQEVRLDKTSGRKTTTRSYALGAGAGGVRTAAGVTWLAADHQGTAQTAVDSVTQTVVRRRQTPFGTARGPVVTWPAEKGFVGGTVDAAAGLTHLGAREYDATIGRFVSVDPIMDLADPQQIHGYTYGDNNPATFSDPTGLAPCSGPDGIGCGHKVSKEGFGDQRIPANKQRYESSRRAWRYRSDRSYRSVVDQKRRRLGLDVLNDTARCPDGVRQCPVAAGEPAKRVARAAARSGEALYKIEESGKKGSWSGGLCISGDIQGLVGRSHEMCLAIDGKGLGWTRGGKWYYGAGGGLSANVGVKGANTDIPGLGGNETVVGADVKVRGYEYGIEYGSSDDGSSSVGVSLGLGTGTGSSVYGGRGSSESGYYAHWNVGRTPVETYLDYADCLETGGAAACATSVSGAGAGSD